MAFAQGGGSYSGDDPYDPAAGGLEAPPMATHQVRTTPVPTNKAVMGKFVELFTTGAWDQFDQVIATDCVLHYPGGVDVEGLDAMVAGWQGVLSQAQRPEVHHVRAGQRRRSAHGVFHLRGHI